MSGALFLESEMSLGVQNEMAALDVADLLGVLGALIFRKTMKMGIQIESHCFSVRLR